MIDMEKMLYDKIRPWRHSGTSLTFHSAFFV